jgi:hypothetical protein
MLICTGDLSGGEEDSDRDDSSSSQLTGQLKCLQIDLRKFGLGTAFHHPTLLRSLVDAAI